MLNGKKIITVMPAYNAAKTLEQTYRDVPLDVVDEIVRLQLPYRHVDGHGQFVAGFMKSRCFAARFADDPPTHFDDRVRLLEYRDEVAGHHDAALGVAPAQQCFDARDRESRQVEGRLVDEKELTRRERPP